MSFQELKETVNCPPVLFLIYNRPDLTQRVFHQIRHAQPTQLFVAADGPRAGRTGDTQLCAQARSIIEQVDWHCEAKTLFREQNTGCKLAVSSALTWFFDHVEEGIILEDDCLPDLTFFRFCAELLNRYRNEDRLMMISGNNFQERTCAEPNSYYFSVYPHIWGWATWRRSWLKYVGDLAGWPGRKNTSWLQQFLADSDAAQYWARIFEKAHAGRIDSWGYPWTYSCWANDGLTVLPGVNLVTNIGFDDRATHTKDRSNAASNLPTQALKFPLRHPTTIAPDRDADRYTYERNFRGSPPRANNKGSLSRDVAQTARMNVFRCTGLFRSRKMVIGVAKDLLPPIAYRAIQSLRKRVVRIGSHFRSDAQLK